MLTANKPQKGFKWWSPHKSLLLSKPFNTKSNMLVVGNYNNCFFYYPKSLYYKSITRINWLRTTQENYKQKYLPQKLFKLISPNITLTLLQTYFRNFSWSFFFFDQFTINDWKSEDSSSCVTDRLHVEGWQILKMMKWEKHKGEGYKQDRQREKGKKLK